MSSKKFRGSARFRDYEKPKVEERFDYADLVRRQIERCLMSSGDPDFVFPDDVQALEALIPGELKDEEYQSDYEKAHTSGFEYAFKKNCGIKMGSIEAPELDDERIPVKRYKDGSIDWNDTNIISPKLIPKENVNWFARFEAAFNMLVRLGVAVRRISRG